MGARRCARTPRGVPAPGVLGMGPGHAELPHPARPPRGGHRTLWEQRKAKNP